MAQVLVLAERDEDAGTVRRSTLALLTLARRLGEPVAVVCGTPPNAGEVRTLRDYGAHRIRWSAAACADVLVTLAADRPAAILIATGYTGQEIAGRVAVRLESGIIADAVDVRPGPEGRPLAVQSCLAGSYLVESDVPHSVPIITVRAGAVVPVSVAAQEPARPSLGAAVHRTLTADAPAAPADPSAAGTTAAAQPAATALAVPPREDPVSAGPRQPAAQVETVEVAESAVSPVRRPDVVSSVRIRRDPDPPLESADIVVAGGRGLGSAAGFAVLSEVAAALGGAVGGTHTATELGWCPRERRIGLTGKTVHPRLYLAAGVSGSVRHRAGMQGAKTVIAVCDDPAAPIFRMADLGVVGDATELLAALLAELARRETSPNPSPDDPAESMEA